MRKFLGVLLLLLLGAALYLLFAPVEIEPVAWDAPDDPGYTGVFAPNTRLADLERLDMGEEGPEDVAVRGGRLYTSSQSGRILSRDLVTGVVREVANTNGVPLGLEFDPNGDLYVADAHRGLLRVRDGEVEVLADTADGRSILYADDVDIAPDGSVVFTDASTRWGAEAIGSTMEASLYEIMEHAGTGRVLRWDPATGQATAIADGLVFPNGIVVEAGGESALVTVTGDYSVVRVPLDGSAMGGGAVTPVVENLPGFPDNINRGPDVGGSPTYILGLVSPRSAPLDGASGRPFLRRVMWRLPKALQPAATDYTHIVVIDGTGRVLASLQDPEGGFAQSTGAVAHGGALYLSSLTEDAVGVAPLPDIYR